MHNNLPKFNHKLARAVSQGFSVVLEQAEPAPCEACSSGPRLNFGSVFTHQYSTAFLQFKPADGVRSILLVVDFSGSMAAMWTLGGAEFVWGLVMLARQGAINLKVFLTGQVAPAEMPVSISFRQFCSLWPYHSEEGFRRTLNHPEVAPHVDDSDIVLCWTDGQLTDGHVNAVEWRAKGVHLIGACLGKPDMPAWTEHGNTTLDKAMRMHFHSGLMNMDAAKLATLVGTHIINIAPRELREQ